MKRLHIFNPHAGSGHSPELLQQGAAGEEANYVTTGVGDAERITYETCLTDPETHFIVYGGDGTLNEAANGIIRAGAGEKALLSAVPIGTGNDFVRSFPEKDRIYTIDVLQYNDRYAINIINIGFDSNVVVRTAFYKKAFPGSAAYIAGVADTLCHKIGENWRVETEDAEGNVSVTEKPFTLALAANCQYYGGGFRSAPLADPADGLIDLITVDKVSRLTFLSLVKDYKNGRHLDPAAQAPLEKFQKYLSFRRCRRIKISGIRNLCIDGEIEETDTVDIRLLPAALRYQAL